MSKLTFPHIMQVPVISTAHIHEADVRLLEKEDYSNSPVLADLQPGFLLSIDEAEKWEGYSDAFNALLSILRNQGFSYARLDPEGPQIASLAILQLSNIPYTESDADDYDANPLRLADLRQ